MGEHRQPTVINPKENPMKIITASFILAALLAACPAFGGEIHEAAKANDVEKVKALLANGADVNGKADEGVTPPQAESMFGPV